MPYSAFSIATCWVKAIIATFVGPLMRREFMPRRRNATGAELA